jgi:hypothetical protein
MNTDLNLREQAEKFITSDVLDMINNNCKHSIPKYNLCNNDDSLVAYGYRKISNSFTVYNRHDNITLLFINK